MAEAPDGCDTRWGHYDYPISLCPIDPGSIELLRGIFDELLPHFSSRQFNVGCDETVDLGQVRSKEVVEKLGAGRVYLDFLLKIYREVRAAGRTMQFWGDIIMEHPELVPEVPGDTIALEWGYQPDHPFDQHGRESSQRRRALLRLPRHRHLEHHRRPDGERLGNLRNAAENGLKHGAVGYLITDWGDAGHWQPLPVSYLGFAYGASLSWACDANRDMDIAQAISVYAFDDPTGTLGRIAYDLGNAYQKTGVEIHNSTVMVRMLQATYEQFAANRSRYPGLNAEGLMAAEAEVDRVMVLYGEVKSGRKRCRSDPARICLGCRHAAPGRRPAGVWMLGNRTGRRMQPCASALAADAERLDRRVWRALACAQSARRLRGKRGPHGEDATGLLVIGDWTAWRGRARIGDELNHRHTIRVDAS